MRPSSAKSPFITIALNLLCAFAILSLLPAFSPGGPATDRESQDRTFVPAMSPDSSVYYRVEEMPRFRSGSQDRFRQYITDNLRYPQAAAENGIQGRVFVRFTVRADGTVGDAEIVKGVEESLDREALRIIRSSPPWTPGKQDGKPVPVSFTFPVSFELK